MRVDGGNYTSNTYIDGVFERKTDGTDEQNTLHIMDDTSRIALLRLGDAMGDTTPPIKYILEDHLGSSVLELKDDGQNIIREEYYPFGETSFGSHAFKRYKYNGKERDGESGLYYYGARYYSAWCCRFVSVDALAMKYNFLTPYSYAINNPVILFDPTGNQAEKADNIGGGGNNNKGGNPQEHSDNIREQEGIESSTDPEHTYTLTEPETSGSESQNDSKDTEYDTVELDFSSDDQQIGIFRPATKEHWEQDILTAAVKDFSFAVLEFIGLNAIDDAVAIWIDPNSSSTDKIGTTLDAVKGFIGGKKGPKGKGPKGKGPKGKSKPSVGGKKSTLTNKQADQFAQEMGWSSRLSPNDIPQNIKKQTGKNPVYSDKSTKSYFSPDKAGHRAGNAWKRFDYKGNRETGIFENGKFKKVSK